MALPKVTTPTYELVLPSTDKKVRFRPFLVKEEKILLIAMENDNDTEMINAIKQDDSKATYAKKISKQDAKLDWNKPAKELERKIRAYNPSPVAHITLKGITMRIWEAKIKPTTNKLKPGTILSEKSTLDVVTSQDLLSITKLQLPGKKIILAKDFLNGHADFISDKLDK